MYKHGVNNVLLTVNEFAETANMKASTIRFYIRRGLLYPAMRGNQPNHQYQYFSLEQLPDVNRIRVLTDMDIGLKEIKRLQFERTPQQMSEFFKCVRDRALIQVPHLEEVTSVISTRLSLLNEGNNAQNDSVHLAREDEVRLILGGINDYVKNGNPFKACEVFRSAAHTPALNSSYPVGGYWDSMEMFMDAPSNPCRFFSPDHNGNAVKPAGKYLIGYTCGFYGVVNDLPDRMCKFARKNGLTFVGPVFNIFPFDELSVSNRKNFLLRVSVQVA